jgi:hypothetical protein
MGHLISQVKSSLHMVIRFISKKTTKFYKINMHLVNGFKLMNFVLLISVKIIYGYFKPILRLVVLFLNYKCSQLTNKLTQRRHFSQFLSNPRTEQQQKNKPANFMTHQMQSQSHLKKPSFSLIIRSY